MVITLWGRRVCGVQRVFSFIEMFFYILNRYHPLEENATPCLFNVQTVKKKGIGWPNESFIKMPPGGALPSKFVLFTIFFQLLHFTGGRGRHFKLVKQQRPLSV